MFPLDTPQLAAGTFISKNLECQSHLTHSMNPHKQGACSKPVLSLAEGRPAQQGRRGFGARSVHGVREGERREERQVCEREARQRPPCLREAAPAEAGNAAGLSTEASAKVGGPFGYAQGMLFQQALKRRMLGLTRVGIAPSQKPADTDQAIFLTGPPKTVTED